VISFDSIFFGGNIGWRTPTLFPALPNQDVAIGSDKYRIFTGKTDV